MTFCTTSITSILFGDAFKGMNKLATCPSSTALWFCKPLAQVQRKKPLYTPLNKNPYPKTGCLRGRRPLGSLPAHHLHFFSPVPATVALAVEVVGGAVDDAFATFVFP